MLRKIGSMAWKELYTTYTDRNLLLIMIATPLALATIIGFAFSGFLGNGGNDIPIRDIPFALVNLDEGATTNGGQNNGQIFVDLLIPGAAEDQPEALLELTDARLMTDPDEARQAVERGELAAAVIIPPDFSANLTYSPTHQYIEPTTIEIYANSGQPISANIVRSIITGIGDQIATGNVAVAVTIDALVERARQDAATARELLAEFNPDFAPAFDPGNNPIRVEAQTVRGEAPSFNPLVYFGASNAILFMLFTARGSAGSVLEEKQDGTLARLFSTPTPRIVILLGKLVGTVVTCMVQLVLLFIFLTLVGSLISGEFQFIWGRDFGSIALVIFAASLAASGLGTLLSSLVKTAQQSDFVGTVIILAMALLSGAFFTVENIPVLRTLSRFTLNYWGTDAFTRLAFGDTNIGQHLLVLLVFGAVTFVAGLLVFNRRLEV
jgi:ABC-2 type transport system permease protein